MEETQPSKFGIDDTSLENLCSGLAARSKKARRFALIGVFVIVLTVALMLFIFFATSLSAGAAGTASYISLNLPGFDLKIEQKQDALIKSSLSEEEPQLRELILESQAKIAEKTFLIDTITSVVVRLGSVFLAIYLTQILVNLTRYHFRLSDHLSSASDALLISKGDLIALEKVMEAISPKHIDFGKFPEAPQDKVADLIKDAIAKLPGN